MDKHAEKAVALHKKGYNCAQSVACAFADELGMDEKEVFRLMEGFGLGMGCMGTCGAVSGMTAIAGMRSSDGNTEKPGSKKISYKASKEMIRRFEEKTLPSSAARSKAWIPKRCCAAATDVSRMPRRSLPRT